MDICELQNCDHHAIIDRTDSICLFTSLNGVEKRYDDFAFQTINQDCSPWTLADKSPHICIIQFRAKISHVWEHLCKIQGKNILVSLNFFQLLESKSGNFRQLAFLYTFGLFYGCPQIIFCLPINKKRIDQHAIENNDF